MTRLRALATVGLWAMLLCAGCDGTEGNAKDDDAALPGDDDERTDDEETNASLDAFILGLADFAEPAAAPPHVTSSTTSREVRDDSIEDCRYDAIEGTTLYESLVSFDPNVDALWPGAIVQTEPLAHGLLSPIALPRAAGTIVLTNAVIDGGTGGEADGPAYSRTLDAPSLASAQQAIADILGSGEVHVAAKASFLSEEAHSLEEAALDVGVSAEWLSGHASAEMEGSWSEARSTYVVRFVQAYFSVAFEPPGSPSGVFDAAVTVDEARPYMADGNPPGAISSVTYGRTLLLKVESSRSSEELRAALDAAFALGLGNVDASVSAETQDVLDEATFSAVALGGDPDAVVALVAPAADRVEALRAYFKAAAGYSPEAPGVPISYSVRRLANNRTIKVGSTVDYEVPDCTVATTDVRVHLASIEVVRDGSTIGQGDITYDVSIDEASVAHGMAHAGNGDVIAVNQDVVLAMPQTDGHTFAVSLVATEGNDPAAISASKTHTFVLDPETLGGSWTQAGPVTVEAGDGNFDLKLTYTLNP